MADIDGSRAALETLAIEYELDDDTLEGLGPAACARLLDGLHGGAELYRLRLARADTGADVREAVAARLAPVAELIWDPPAVAPGVTASMTSRAVTFAASTSEFELLEILEGIEGVLERVSRRAHLSRPPPASAISIRPPAPTLASARVASAGALGSLTTASPRAGVVAVEVERLDRLLEAVGELGVVQHGIGALVEKARSGAGQAELLCEAQRLQHSFERSIGELRSCALETRMVPVLALLDALGACAREFGNAYGTPLQIQVDECSLELDKQVADAAFEPLAQWLGSRVEFGFEHPEERLAEGKPRFGTVAVHARAFGGQCVVVEIDDDGRAVEAQPALALSESDRLQSQLRVVGASVEWSGAPGARNRLQVTLPITRALMLTLLVLVRGRTLALPLASVQEVSRCTSSATVPASGEARIELHDEHLPLIDLGQWLSLPLVPDPAPARHVVTVRHGSRRLCLLVERAIGQQSLLVKPLGASLREVRAVTGAADLGDGRLALVLDPSALFEDERALAEPALPTARESERGAS